MNKTELATKHINLLQYTSVFTKAVTDIFSAFFEAFKTVPIWIIIPIALTILTGILIWLWYNFIR
jgi:hypothetical protein